KRTGTGFETKKISRPIGGASHCEPDISDEFIISPDQKRQILINLMGLNSEIVNAVITHPSNAGQVLEAIGFPGLTIPGADQRQKQLMEIKQLLQAAPAEIPDESGEKRQIPSIEPEEIDDDQIHISICDSFLVSDKG